MKILATVKNNWKKSLFGLCTISYGTYYLIQKKHTADLLQAYCFEALKFGKQRVNAALPIRRVTIFLNPIANGERGRFLYDNNVAPLLHLSGLDVRLVRLERNSEANEYMAALDLNDTDCIVVAGGNATLNECISGLLNRPDANEFLKKVPIGLIPIGETNRFAQKWFMTPAGPNRTNNEEVRLLGDSALSIIRGVSIPADLMKISLVSEPSQPVAVGEADLDRSDENLQDRGAYSLLKENKIYALSNFSAGIMTETDSQLSKYWYYGFLKNHMNRYFTDRYLRRQPVRYSFNYILKCHEEELRAKLNNLINNIDERVSKTETPKLSLMQKFYYNFFGIASNFKLKETTETKETRLNEIKRLETLIKRTAEKENSQNSGKLFETKLIQSQIEMNINSCPILENNQENDEPSAIDNVVVKDVKYNFDDMFLAQRRSLDKFELKKTNANEKNIKFKKPEDNMENFFCVEIDGEIYKLDNRKGHELKICVEHMEKAIKLLRHDPELSKSIQVNYWPRVYMNKKHTGDMPPIKPFENFYISFSKRDDLIPTLKKLLNF